MRYSRFKLLAVVVVLVVAVIVVGYGLTLRAQTSKYTGLGKAPTPQDLGNLAWSSGRSGKGLPPGKGTAKDAMPIYFAKCVMCHGANLEGVHWGPMNFSPFMGPRLGGGNGLPSYKPVEGRVVTLAYSAPWPTIIFNTIAVEMPFYNPGTLKADDVYNLTALVLFKNGLIKEDEVMDAESLPKVQMPNHASFPASDEIFMDMKKRGCIETYGICRDHY